jgi:hypothetical protein
MRKEEPAWKAELREAMDERFPLVRNAVTRDAIREFCESQILAAEQRGFQAGVNKTGDSVGKLREQLKTAEERGRREALTEAAKAIRSYSKEWVAWPYKVQAMADAADLIDPDAP